MGRGRQMKSQIGDDNNRTENGIVPDRMAATMDTVYRRPGRVPVAEPVK